jgi:glycerol-3-phosphate O-acyltransferase
MYHYNLKFTIESEKNPLWRDEVKQLKFKHSCEKDGVFNDVLWDSARKFIHAYYPNEVIHLSDIEVVEQDNLILR